MQPSPSLQVYGRHWLEFMGFFLGVISNIDEGHYETYQSISALFSSLLGCF